MFDERTEAHQMSKKLRRFYLNKMKSKQICTNRYLNALLCSYLSILTILLLTYVVLNIQLLYEICVKRML